MHIPHEKRLEYWNHFIEAWALRKLGGGNGVTSKRLSGIKTTILKDADFWIDVVGRHNGMRETPEQMAISDRANYEHCLGNFWGMTYETMVEQMERKIIN